jgi:pimeloyl-ACP methyl ester carboxylesterase
MQHPDDAYVLLEERGGLRLHYLDWGGEGRAVLLLHGLSSSAHIWDLLAPVLAESSRVIAMDQRSHGLSDRPDDGYGFADTTADVAAFIEALELDEPVVVGHSWGANVAVQLAHDYEDAAGGLVLVDGGFLERPREVTWDQAEKEMRPPDIDGIPVERFIEYTKNFAGAQSVEPKLFQHMVLSNFIVRDEKVYRPLAIPNHMKIARAIFDQRPSELLPNVETPVMIVPAIREASSDTEQKWQEYRERGLAAIARVRPDIKIQRMQDTIHDVPVQRPEDLARLIADFVSELD